MKKCAAEFLGTFALVFAGTGAIVIDSVTGGGVTHAGIAFTFGLIVMAMIYALGTVGLEAMFAGPICGASMNPARSIAPALISGSIISLWIYILAPLVGAAIAVPCWLAIRSASAAEVHTHV